MTAQLNLVRGGDALVGGGPVPNGRPQDRGLAAGIAFCRDEWARRKHEAMYAPK